jgi:tetratricopeptide (TPR) repeat protein
MVEAVKLEGQLCGHMLTVHACITLRAPWNCRCNLGIVGGMLGLCLTNILHLLSAPVCLYLHRAKLADYYHARGYAARKQGNFAGAVEEYSRALSLTPSHFKALFNRGFSYDKVRLPS